MKLPMTGETLTHPPWELLALGTGGVGTQANRSYPSTLLKVGTHRTLIDAGDGTLRQLARWDSVKQLDVIVITALTTERIGGLATVLDNPLLRVRRRRPLLVGPVGTADALKALKTVMSDDPHVAEVIEVEDETSLSIGAAELVAIPIEGGSLGVRLEEPDAPGRFDVEAATRLGLKPGPAFGRLLRGETVDGVEPRQVVGPSRQGRLLAVLGPCRPAADASEFVDGAQLLVVVAPYTDERQEVAVESGTMTGVEAALLATEARVGTLALMHVSATARTGYARRETAQFHSRVIIPADGDRFTLQLSDEGQVKHVPASAARTGRPA
jgi:ribonuclease Z